MNTPLKFAVTAMSLFLAVGCAKSDNDKAKDQQKATQETLGDADKASADLVTSFEQLKSAPEPTEKFNDQELKAYEELVRRNEENLVRVQSYNGKDGVVIKGQESLEQTRQFIIAKKAKAQEVRSKQAAAGVEQSKDQKVAALKAQYDTDSNFVEGEGVPTKGWAPEKFQKYEEALNRIDTTLHDLEVTDGQGFATAARKAANDARRAILTEARK